MAFSALLSESFLRLFKKTRTCQDRRSQRRESKAESPEYEASVTVAQKRSVGELFCAPMVNNFASCVKYFGILSNLCTNSLS